MDGTEVVAVDVGGTTIKAGILTCDGPMAVRRVPTGVGDGPTAVVERIISITTELVHDRAAIGAGREVAAVGVVVPGIVDETTGVARLAVNVGWHDVDLRRQLLERIHCPLAIGHDVRAGALAEARWGVAAGATSALFVSIGTGIAAALVIDGEVVPGTAWEGGEIGQVHVGDVTLEAIASARSIAERYVSSGAAATGPVPATEVVRRAGLGDPCAAAVWQQAIDALAEVLANAVSVIDPAVIVIAGGLSRAKAALLVPLRAGLDSRLRRSAPTITTARFGDGASWVGAALLAIDAAGLHPPEHLVRSIADWFAGGDEAGQPAADDRTGHR